MPIARRQVNVPRGETNPHEGRLAVRRKTRCHVPEEEKSEINGDRPAAATPKGMIDHKELATFAFQRTRMPMVVSDARQPDYPIVLANDAFLELTGYLAEDLLGRNCRMLQGPDTSRTAVAEIRTIIAQERGGNVELLNYRKDGSVFWNQLHLSPIHDDEGRLAYYFASQIDATEFRKIQTLEEAEHRLLMEVDHRTKNVLAIVDSIVRLSRSDNAAVYSAYRRCREPICCWPRTDGSRLRCTISSGSRPRCTEATECSSADRWSWFQRRLFSP